MHTISRRQALILGGIGVAGTMAGGAGLIWTLASPSGWVTGGEMTQPQNVPPARRLAVRRLQMSPRACLEKLLFSETRPQKVSDGQNALIY